MPAIATRCQSIFTRPCINHPRRSIQKQTVEMASPRVADLRPGAGGPDEKLRGLPRRRLGSGRTLVPEIAAPNTFVDLV
jgi:hypothetical protein